MKYLLLILLFLISCNDTIVELEKPDTKPCLIVTVEYGHTNDGYYIYKYNPKSVDNMDFVCEIEIGETDTLELEIGYNLFYFFISDYHGYHEPFEYSYTAKQGSKFYLNFN